MECFPEKLRKARKKAKMNQTELADAVGLTQRSLTNYERGCAIPRQSTLRKLAKALGVTVEYLTRDDVEDPQTGRLREERAEQVREEFGSRGVAEMSKLLDANLAFMAGGEVPQDAKDAFFDALMTAYVTCKNEARAKYTPKSLRKDDEKKD